jgi:hypothetical protein
MNFASTKITRINRTEVFKTKCWEEYVDLRKINLTFGSGIKCPL